MEEEREKFKAIPLYDHLYEWSRDEIANAGDDVAALLDSPGWAALMRSLEDRLRFEQKLLMGSAPQEDARNQRTFGQWAGLRQVRGLAEGIVRAGKEAQARMRGAEKESA